MYLTPPAEVIRYLRSPVSKVRTGLWLLPAGLSGDVRNEAARLLVDAADAREPILAGLAPDQAFLGLSAEKVLHALDALSLDERSGDCALVYNLDLLLARLSTEARAAVWDHCFHGFGYRPRALLITIPATATRLAPTRDQLDRWRQEGRLVE
jgi:hypothetical protein